ncbi:TonB-dependent receptor plug domain-containing protein [Sphingomonas sanxanigenens]|uniref:TonB-dependent receptor n=1 Tax=Sphingomonas sanxanigenens DSM 19645 = NX02 TaxID=1123269 RepID=W0A8D9_9SPHN|nr:TonB-dependent receptor [Sphingomonas sanxanigenens]AHE53366.1 TonB-dependent receptor [Sphingomonas sanxanigenens DSM 19645 = NX02]
MKFTTAGALVALTFACAPVMAQTVEQAPAPDAADAGDAIVVTGTRERSRTQFETIAPVDVLPAAIVKSSVSGDLTDNLAQLLPSFNVQRLPAADGQAFVRPATLRGLSSDQTLVLVNGKRYHRSALLGTRGAQAPDLASIPTLAIKRIEVLRDGASAQYGSDAIAGVINIILEDQPGMEAFAQFSQYYEGDGEEYRGGARGGVPLGDRGSIVFTAQYDHSDATSRTRQRPDAIAFQDANPNLVVPNPVQRWGQPDEERIRGAIDARYELAEGATLYAFGTTQSGEGVTDFNWRNPVGTGSVYNPSSAFPGFSFNTLYPVGFTPRFGTRFSDLQANGGVRGDIGENFSYDLSGSFGRSRIAYEMSESLNASLGPDSPTSFYIGELEQREFNLNADFVYRLPVGTAEPINIAFGGERRRETYQVSEGDPASYAIGPGAATGLAPNSNGFPGFSPDIAGTFAQTSYAGYVDVEWQPVTILTLGAAGRYEDFSAFGDTFNYKLSARLEPVRGIAVRGTYSTGFRAPTPAQLNTRQTTQGLDTTTLTIFNQGRLSPSDPLAIAFGAKPLTPEESTSATAGLTFQTGIGFSGSIDLYQIDVDDRFSQSRTFAVPASVPNPQRFTSISYFTNDFDTRTRGIDAVLSYTHPLAGGRVNASIAYNYNQTEVRSGTTAAIPNETQRRVFEDRLPQHNGTATLGYDIGGLSLLVRGRYYGSWTDVSGNATGELFQDFGGIALFDVAASYRFDDHFTIRVGAENVFDTYPDEATNQAVRGLIYSRNAPYDTDGGQYYVRLGVNF